MQLEVKYQGRIATTEEVTFIKEVISSNPTYSRSRLSRELCQSWNWVQSNGALKAQVCRGYLLALERAGYIKLPVQKFIPPNPLANRKKPTKIEIVPTAIQSKLRDIQPVRIVQVCRTSSEKLYNSLLDQYHYLGYVHPVGEHLKYLVYSGAYVLGCFGLSSSPRHLSSRDNFIGWSTTERKRNLNLICYNTRFLILPWIKVPNLASHLLSIIAKNLSADWQRVYNHPVYFMETFVDTERFKGTCYRASNWQYLGTTTGRGNNDHTNKVNRSIKAVWSYALTPHFRRLLTQ